MFVLELAAHARSPLVLLPLFIIPAKRVGRQLQGITREGMNLNAVDEHHHDRALQRVRARCS